MLTGHEVQLSGKPVTHVYVRQISKALPVLCSARSAGQHCRDIALILQAAFSKTVSSLWAVCVIQKRRGLAIFLRTCACAMGQTLSIICRLAYRACTAQWRRIITAAAAAPPASG